MDTHKFCFIYCANDDLLLSESLKYVESLNIPEGYKIEIRIMRDSSSITSAYNKAMDSSDAKYKIYMHQDVFIINKNFPNDILALFDKYPQLGLLGMAGAKQLPKSGIWWESDHTLGTVYHNISGKMGILSTSQIYGDYESVQAADGLIMITQYDIPWREDIFRGWHFYDISQSIEFIKCGYEVGIPRQDTPWCLHDCGISTLNGYEENRWIFLKEYGKMLFSEDSSEDIDCWLLESKKTSIIILTHNKLGYTKECISSIRQFTSNAWYEIIVVDNNSTDGTVEWLKEQDDIKLILNTENLGFPKGCNQGIEIAEGDSILLLNNDTIVTHNWLKNLNKCLYSSSEIGAVGAVTNSCSYYQAIGVPYSTITEMLDFAESFNISDPKKWEERIKLIGFCMLVKKSVVDKIGPLDEVFSPGNFEDDDYSFRIRKAGYKLMLCKDTFIHHFGSVSFKETGSKFTEIYLANEKKFLNKWGFIPSYYTSIRNDLISLIDSPISDDIAVLEVGCACGASLLKIKSIYKNAKLYGIELNENAAEIAGTAADVKVQNIETPDLGYREGSFDYIIFGDVLEHLLDPWSAIKNIRKYLKPTGKVLISLPNIMHYDVVRKLINGSWEYEDAGILDRTHLRFFTLKEIDKMLTQAGYKNMFYSANVLKVSEEDNAFIEALTNLGRPELKKQFSVYQYVIRAHKE